MAAGERQRHRSSEVQQINIVIQVVDETLDFIFAEMFSGLKYGSQLGPQKEKTITRESLLKFCKRKKNEIKST